MIEISSNLNIGDFQEALLAFTEAANLFWYDWLEGQEAYDDEERPLGIIAKIKGPVCELIEIAEQLQEDLGKFVTEGIELE